MNNAKGYSQFVDKMAEVMKDELGEKAIVGTTWLDKPQGESYYGITVASRGRSNIGFVMNLESLYEPGNDRNVEDRASQVRDSIMEHLEQIENQMRGIAENLDDYSYMKDKLMVQVISTEQNQNILASIPHETREDLSIIYRCILGENNGGIATILFTNDMMNNYGISSEQLYQDAMANSQKMFPALIRTMHEVMVTQYGEGLDDPTEKSGLYIATCNEGLQGAGCMFYPDFMEQASDMLNGDFFILPSSIHEVLLLPDDGKTDYHDLSAMVKSINETQVAPVDRLSNTVYHYDSKDRVFERAEAFDSRKTERKRTQGRHSVSQKIAEKQAEIHRKPSTKARTSERNVQER